MNDVLTYASGIIILLNCINLLTSVKQKTFKKYDQKLQMLQETTFTILLHLSDNNHSGKMHEVLEKYGKEVLKDER